MMADFPAHLVDDVARILNSLRASFDASYTNRNRLVRQLDTARAYYLKVESIRYAFRSRTRHRIEDWDDWHVAAEELIDELQELFDDPQFMEVAGTLRFRLVPLASRARAVILDDRFSEPDLTAADAVMLLLKTVPLPTSPASDGPSQGGARLRRIIPPQKVSPVQFDIRQDRVVITPQTAVPNQDEEIISAAKEQLIDRGERILEELGRSNCDPRLLENVRDLQRQLCSEQDIIRLGLSNIGCAMMTQAFECELPDAVSSMLKAQNVGVSMYVAQFSEWLSFSEKAAAVSLDETAVTRIYEAAGAIIQELKDNRSLADPEVPKVVELLREMIADPQTATKRAVFAVLRTIENLVIRVYQYGAEFLDQAISKTSGALSTSLSKVAAAGLLGLALAGALHLAPLASQLPEMAWITRATEIVRYHLDSLPT